MVALALILFPKLALGMSGFETGVAVMTHVKGDDTDTYDEPARPDSEHQEAAGVGGRHHERLLDRQFADHDMAHPGGGVQGRRRGEWPRPGLPRARVPGRGLRHGLRRVDRRDPVVRRRVGHGRPAQSRPAVSAAIRHGARMGGGDASAGRGDHGHLVSRHLDVRSERRCPGRGVCHRRAGARSRRRRLR